MNSLIDHLSMVADLVLILLLERLVRQKIRDPILFVGSTPVVSMLYLL